MQLGNTTTSTQQESWDQLGGGVRGQIGVRASVLAVDSNDTLYVGGSFLWAGETCSNQAGCSSIALWNGTAWHPVGEGVTGGIEALAIDSQDNLYVGGSFESAGACTEAEGCVGIAMWNGATWSGFGSGIGAHAGERVYALAIDSSGNLYAGGNFTRAGDCTAEDGCAFLAMWDGATWGPVGGGVDRSILASVNSLVIDASDHLYAGGNFTSAGACADGNGCQGIAKWDGAAWSPVGGGVEGRVAALAQDSSGDLFAAGFFSGAGACTSANGCINIARWDGAAWHPLGSGLQGYVGYLAVDEAGNLYTRGETLSGAACPAGDNCQTIIQWDGADWNVLGLLSGGVGSVHALALDSTGSLYAGGQFIHAGGCTATAGCNNIARWNGSAWGPLESGLHGSGQVSSILIGEQGDVYIAGAFMRAGACVAVGCQNIARWDGSAWQPVSSAPGGMPIGTVSDLALDGEGNLYAGGTFEGVGGCSGGDGCNNIARWDGASWHALGAGMNNAVGVLAHDNNGNLYAGGVFTGAGDCTEVDGCGRIARWDGAAWHALGSGFPKDSQVMALQLDAENYLYAGGRFEQAGACTADEGCNGIAMWDGAAWNPLGSGIGNFSGSSLQDYVLTLTLRADGNLVVGGRFSGAGNCTVEDGCNNIALWDGADWHPFGSGIRWFSNVPTSASGGTFALAEDRAGRLYAGGWFSSAGACTAAAGCNDLARWDGAAWCSLDGGAWANVYALEIAADDTLYVGGGFNQIGTCTAGEGCHAVARWTINPHACRLDVYLPNVTSME